MKKKLTDLNPMFLGCGGPGVTRNGLDVPRREAVGIDMDCPCGCDRRLYVPFLNPLDGGPPAHPGHGWERTGDTFETLTLKPSIRRMDGCKWHGFLTNGELVEC